jgi:ligand-binding sensor domain-containing protein
VPLKRKNKMRIKITLKFLLLLTIQIAFGQKAELISKENSELIDDDLLSVTVDKNGDKWIGTSKFGLVKLSNGKFENLNKDNSKIKGDYISPIFTDSKGNVWVSYSNPSDGIAKFDGKEWTTFTAKDLNTSEISVISIVEDTDGNILFGGINGVFKFDGETWKKVELPDVDFTVRTMDIASNGDIAIGHNSGLLIKKGNDWQNLNEENSELRLGTVRGVKFTKDNKLIVGYGGGFGDGGFSIIENEKWAHYNKMNSKVPDHMVRDIEIGENGVIWMATNNGIIIMKGEEIMPVLFRDGMYKNVILDIEIEGDKVWIATNFGLIKIE